MSDWHAQELKRCMDRLERQIAEADAQLAAANARADKADARVRELTKDIAVLRDALLKAQTRLNKLQWALDRGDVR